MCEERNNINLREQESWLCDSAVLSQMWQPESGTVTRSRLTSMRPPQSTLPQQRVSKNIPTSQKDGVPSQWTQRLRRHYEDNRCCVIRRQLQTFTHSNWGYPPMMWGCCYDRTQWKVEGIRKWVPANRKKLKRKKNRKSGPVPQTGDKGYGNPVVVQIYLPPPMKWRSSTKELSPTQSLYSPVRPGHFRQPVWFPCWTLHHRSHFTVMKFSHSAISEEKVALAVSIDVIDAFNSLLGKKITTDLAKHNVPLHLRHVIKGYHSDSSIICNTEDDTRFLREITKYVT